MRLPTFSYNDGTFDLGRFDRAPVTLHFSFFLTAAVLTLPFWWRGHGHGPLLVLGGTVIIFGSILLHELAHAAVARHYRVPIQHIEINWYGGMVHFARRPNRMAQDVAITVAGPLSNMLLAGGALILLWLLPQPEAIEFAGRLAPIHVIGGPERLLRFAIYLNTGLCLVNLLPAFPLDGGRLTYLVVARRWDNRTATLVVGMLGLVFAVISMIVTLVMLLAGFPIIAPPSFQTNWAALQAARRGQSIPV